MQKTSDKTQQRKLGKPFFCLLLVFSGFSAAHGQWLTNVAVGTIYDDNAFRTYAAEADYITQVSGYLAREKRGERWQGRLFYRGNYSLFVRYRDRDYFVQRAGLAISGRGGEHRNTIFAGLNGTHRANRQAYNYYDLAEGKIYGNCRLYLSASTSTQFGYRWRTRQYLHLDSFSYFEHYWFARLTNNFPSRTTLVIEGNYGRKSYTQEFVPEEDSMPAGDYGHGQHGGGRGHMHGGLSGGMGNMPADENASRPTVAQLVTSARLAQALTSTTGASIEFVLRRNLQDGTRYLAGQVAGYDSEDELFDDRYGYESEEMNLSLTQLLPWQITLRAGAGWQQKVYPNRLALDLAGNPLPSEELREDRRFEGWLSFSKAITISGGFTVDLIADYDLIDNHSNDEFYDYRSNAVTLGIGMSY